jgi:hypothetical protein
MNHLKRCYIGLLVVELALNLRAQPILIQPQGQQAFGGTSLSNLRVRNQSADGTETILTVDFSYDGVTSPTARILPVITDKKQPKISGWFGANPVSVSAGRGTISLRVKFFNDEPGVPPELTTDHVKIVMLTDGGNAIISQGLFAHTIKWGSPNARPAKVPAVETPVETPNQAQAQAREKARQEAEAKLITDEKAQAEAKAREEARLKAQAEAKARQEAEVKRIADEKAQAEAKAREEARLKAQAEAKARQEAEAKRIADEKAQAEAKAREEARLKTEAESKARQEAEAKRIADEKAQAEAKAREEARLKAQAEAKGRQEAEAKRIADEKAQAEAKAREEARLKTEAESKARQEAEAKRIAEEKTKAAAPVSQPAPAKAKFALSSKTKSKVTSVDVVNRNIDRTEMTIAVEYQYSKEDSMPKMGVDVASTEEPAASACFTSPVVDLGRGSRNFVMFPVKLEAAAARSFQRATLPTDKVWIYLADASGAKSYIYQSTMILSWHIPGGGGTAAPAAEPAGAHIQNTVEIDSFKQNDLFSGYVTVRYNLATAPSAKLRLKVYDSAKPATADWFATDDVEIRPGPGVQLLRIVVPKEAASPDVFSADTVEVQMLDKQGAQTASVKKQSSMSWAKPK